MNEEELTIDKDLCAGCGNCIAIAPDIFDWDDDNKAEIINQPNNKEMVQNAIGSCPTGAIYWKKK